jgi:hypothetical protein
MPTSTSSGALLLAFATFGGIPPEAGILEAGMLEAGIPLEAGFLEAQLKTANNKHKTAIIPIIFFIVVLLKNKSKVC